MVILRVLADKLLAYDQAYSSMEIRDDSNGNRYEGRSQFEY